MNPDAGYTLRDQQLMKEARRYFAWQARLVRQALGRRVVEVGCGVGNFTRHLLDRELVVALDVEPDCLSRLRQELGSPANLICRRLDVTDPDFVALQSHQVDSIVCLNVLEHVRDDLLALRNMAAILPPGGTVVLIAPAFAALYGPIDRNLGHYRRYSMAALRKLAADAGFSVKTLRYMNCVGALGWWLNARILKRTQQSPSQIAVFDRWGVPFLQWLEDRVPVPFGQSLFAVLVR